jgi:hypothetical protein
MKEKVVPEQEQGSSVDIVHALEMGSREEAIALYRQSAARLLNVNSWAELCGKRSAKFEVTYDSGEPVNSPACEGCYFRISIPAPGPVEGEGYDWVQVEKIEEHTNKTGDEQQLSIRVRPSANPAGDKDNTAHFFSPEATSTFRLTRKGNGVAASVHGRNETANTTTDSVADKLRNTVVSIGARAGFSSLQWKGLVKGVIEGPPSDR